MPRLRPGRAVVLHINAWLVPPGSGQAARLGLALTAVSRLTVKLMSVRLSGSYVTPVEHPATKGNHQCASSREQQQPAAVKIRRNRILAESPVVRRDAIQPRH